MTALRACATPINRASQYTTMPDATHQSRHYQHDPASQLDHLQFPKHCGSVAHQVTPPWARSTGVRNELGEFLVDELVERWFAELTNRKLRRSAHRSLTELEADIRKLINAWNKDPKPFAWTKTADEILGTLAAYCRRISDSGH